MVLRSQVNSKKRGMNCSASMPLLIMLFQSLSVLRLEQLIHLLTVFYYVQLFHFPVKAIEVICSCWESMNVDNVCTILSETCFHLC